MISLRDPLSPSPPARTAMSPTAAPFAQLLWQEVANTQVVFRGRVGPDLATIAGTLAAKSRG